MTPPERSAPGGPTPPPWLPALSARYDEIREIGRGGMGIVYRARDWQTGDVVALKVLRPELTGDPAIIERFKSELLLARRITHKNVCRLYELSDFGAVSAISMEFVEGDSLRALLTRQDSLSIRFGLKVVRQILAGLGEAHAQGVVHRDLKPENIHIGTDGGVKLMDFGIARASDSRATSTGTAIGTPAYMSPEQVEGRAADARSDIYALGLVMYEMFCGQPAFSHPSPVGLLAKQRHETPVAPHLLDTNVPLRVERAILKCLEKDPARRFQSVAELQHALLDDAGPAPTPVMPALSAVTGPLVTWSRTDTLIAGAAAIGVAIFVALVPPASLAARSRVAFDPAVLRQIVQQHAQRLGVTVSGEPATARRGLMREYWYLLDTAGTDGAHAVANSVVPLFQWRLQYPDGPTFTVDTEGRLVSFVRGGKPPEGAPLAAATARERAEVALRDLFGAAPADLELASEGTVGAQTTVTWRDPRAPHGLSHRYVAVVDPQGIATLTSTWELPRDVNLPLISMETWYTPISIVVVVLLAIVGFARRHRIDLAARWRMVLAVAGFLATFLEGVYYVGSGMEPGSQFAVGLGIGFTASVLWVLMSAAAEDRVRRWDPSRLLSMTLLFGATARSSICGLALLRGALIGLALLGVDALCVWLITTRLGGLPDPDMALWFLGLGLSSRSMAVPLAGAIIQMLWIGAFVAFTVSLAARQTEGGGRAAAWPILALTLIGAHFSMAAVQPYYWTLPLLLVEFAVLVLAFRRYDLLTLFTAVFTFAFVWGTFMLHVALGRSGAQGPAVALTIAALALAASAAVAFQARLRGAFQSVAGTLD